MDKEINKIIDNLEACFGIFDYMITPAESKLLVSYIKELKQKYMNAVADYETTKAEKEQLKKKLENANEKIILLQASEPMLNYKKALEETQQKEFINYLEDLIKHKRLNATCMFEYNNTVLPLKEILQKYKETIGVLDEDNKQ